MASPSEDCSAGETRDKRREYRLDLLGWAVDLPQLSECGPQEPGGWGLPQQGKHLCVSTGRQVGPFSSHSPGLELSLWTSLEKEIESFILSFVGFHSFHPWLLLAVYNPH